jgi:lysophospholipase L1-like esterase
MKYFVVLFLVFILLSATSSAQQMPVDDETVSRNYPFIRSIFNRIQNNSGLDSFYKKLYRLKSSNNDAVSIVHIGDSHIQADFLTAVVRNGLQDFFGDAGRGLVFPYQLAQSNGPDDISSSSNIRWQFNRLAHPEIPIPYGISGHGIRTSNSEPSINLSLRTDNSYFTRVKLFTDSSMLNAWTIQTDNNDSLYLVKKEEQAIYHTVELGNKASRFVLTAQSSGNIKELYGVSLENSQQGVLYHTIGVNGARYDQFNNASLFWQQLPALHADLYIVSLGTNEAQFAVFSETTFIKNLSLLLEKLRQASPNAAILVTTPPDSYRARRPNTVLRQLNTSLANFCNKNYIPFWDLYQITAGYGSASSWARRGLMMRDRVHFTPEGYKLQGNLLLIALGKGYNEFVN